MFLGKKLEIKAKRRRKTGRSVQLVIKKVLKEC